MCAFGYRIGTILLAALVWSGGAFEANAGEKEEAVGSDFTTTHKQSRIIKPMCDGKPVELNTFCLDKDGNVLACVGGDSVQYVMNDDGSQQVKTISSPRQLQVYSPDGALLRAVDLPFKPTALNAAADGSIFVAGAGRVAHVSADGQLLTTVDSPHIGDMDSFRQRIEEAAKKQVEESTSRFRDQVTRIEERIAALKEKPEEELTELDKRRMLTYEQQKSLYETQLKAMEQVAGRANSSDAAVSRKLGITALAVTSRDIFLCCNAVEGTGYEVWRMTHEFSEPTKVVSSLGGCCGQCDIQATDEHLVLAENTKFKVALLDRDGNRQTDFGKGDRKAVDGFGSCCNPMNVRCCDNGDILTAESSIGTIKRFRKDGELLGVVGKAKIGGGCKHVALGFDAKRDRYYMMNIDKDHICVLVPNAEAPELTSDEMLAKAAREGWGEKLVGEWSLDGKSPAVENEAKNFTAKTGAARISAASGAAKLSLLRIQSDPYSANYLHFEADGKLTTQGGSMSSSEQGWECIRQDGNTLFVSKIQGNIQYYEYKIEFVSDDEATITLMHNERVLGSNRYKRVKPEAVAVEAEAADSKVSAETEAALKGATE